MRDTVYMRLDTLRLRSTPEGVELALRTAGPHLRGWAWFVDVMITSFGTGMIGGGLGLLGNAGMGLYLIVAFLVNWFYPVACEVLFDGATVGKKLLRILVVHEDGTPVGLPASLIRNLVRFADVFPFFYGAGLVSCLLTKNCQRLGDLAAGTLVVHRDSETSGLSVPEHAPVPPPFPLEHPEQRALIAYGERVSEWTNERQVELAELLNPVTGQTGAWAVDRLLGLASWLVGRR